MSSQYATYNVLIFVKDLQMSTHLKVNNISYNISRLDDVEVLHKIATPVLNAVVAPLQMPAEESMIHKIPQALYETVTVGTQYYVHRSLLSALAEIFPGNDTKVINKALVKIAFCEQFKNFSTDATTKAAKFTSFMFGHDKKVNLEARGRDLRYIDRFDYFKGCRELKKVPGGDDYYIIRHGGTSKGANAYSGLPERRKANADARASTRSTNMKFLRALMYGPKNVNQALHCPYHRFQIEEHEMVSLIKQAASQTCFELHHAKFVNGKSTTKGQKDPSYYMNKADYTNFDAETINEMLGIISLSRCYHGKIHKFVQHDDIQNWIHRYSIGSVSEIPHHWKNQKFYEQTIDWLIEQCDNYTEDNAMTWEEFNAENAFTDAERDLIIDSLTEDDYDTIEFEVAGLDRDLV